MKPLISIIVPIYNVENYITECIESVLKQSYRNFELLLVNDGSLDNSGEICESYLLKDNRIKFINKKNGGLSDARNAGMRQAKGEYISFLDGDDFMSNDALEKIVNSLTIHKGLDMLTCAHMTQDPEGEKKLAPLPYASTSEPLDKDEFLTSLIESPTTYWGSWKSIYRRKVIENNSLEFKFNLIGAEDCDFYMRFIRIGNSFGFLNMPIVNYRIDRIGSITHTMSKNAVLGQLKVFYENYNYYKMNNDILSFNVSSFFANKFGNAISLIHHLENIEDIQEVVSYIESRKNILNNTKGFKYQFSKYVWRSFGYFKGSVLLNKISRQLRRT